MGIRAGAAKGPLGTQFWDQPLCWSQCELSYCRLQLSPAGSLGRPQRGEEKDGRASRKRVRRHCPTPDQAPPPLDRQLRPRLGGSDVLAVVRTKSSSGQSAQPQPSLPEHRPPCGSCLILNSPARLSQASESPCQARASFFRLGPPGPRPSILSPSGARVHGEEEGPPGAARPGLVMSAGSGTRPSSCWC